MADYFEVSDDYVIRILLDVGKDAEIKSPVYLREKYKNELKNIIEKYR